MTFSTSTLFILIALASSSYAVADDWTCSNTEVSVKTTRQDLFAVICKTVEDTNAFLESINLEVPSWVTIETVDSVSNISDIHAVGQYDCRNKLIKILEYDAALKSFDDAEHAFGLNMSDEVWQSYISHELAHAATDLQDKCNMRDFLASEYVSSITKISFFTETTRRRVLEKYDGLSGFTDKSDITEIYYSIAPSEFAVKSYLHFIATPDKKGFIQKLLESSDSQ